MSKKHIDCYTDGAINNDISKIKNEGAGFGVVAFKNKQCLGMWGKYSPKTSTSYEAEVGSLFFGGDICIKRNYKPVTLYNDCVTPRSLKTNGYSEDFENMSFKLNGKLKYIQHVKGTKGYGFHNKRYCIADKIARYCREKKKDFEKVIVPRKIDQNIIIPLDLLFGE